VKRRLGNLDEMKVLFRPAGAQKSYNPDNLGKVFKTSVVEAGTEK
jgi:hypothetical protein